MLYPLNSNERDGRILSALSEDDVFVCTLRTLGSKRPTNVRLPPHGASGKRGWQTYSCLANVLQFGTIQACINDADRILFDFGSSSVYASREICNGEHFDGHYGHISNAK